MWKRKSKQDQTPAQRARQQRKQARASVNPAPKREPIPICDRSHDPIAGPLLLRDELKMLRRRRAPAGFYKPKRANRDRLVF